MKLQEKSFVVIICLLIAVILTVSVFYTTILLSSYTVLEEQYVAQDLDQAVNKFNDELATMSLTASDWGPWDDTVAFVHGEAPDYLHSNLQSYGFDNLDLNLIVITDKEGTVLFSGAYDLRNRTMVPVPVFFRERLDLKNPLMNMSDPHRVTPGLVMLPEGPILVVSHPVMYSNYSGTPHGVVIMGRYLNRDEVSRLAALTRPTLTFSPVDDPNLPAGILSRIRETPGPIHSIILPLDADQVAGYSLITDIYGNDALVLGITEPRDIYRQGINTTEQVILIILAAGLILGLGVIFLMDRAVLGRIRSLADQVNTIGKSPGGAGHVEIEGDDELSGLALDINGMLMTITRTHEGLLQSEARFRELADLLPQVVYEVDIGGNLKYTNHIASGYFGYTEDDFRNGMNVMQMLIPGDLERASAAFRAMAGGRETRTPNEYTALRKDGSTFPVSIYASPVVEDGRTTGLRGIIVDITDRKRAEDALRLANRQLSLLTSITRHDINNQMVILLGYTTLIEKKQANPAFDDYFRKIHAAADRITTMIQFTKEYESIGSHAPVWQDCRTLVTAAITQAPHGSIAVENSVPAGIGVFADPLIVKVFYNLIDNAVRHGGKITTIRFSVQDSGDNPVIICEDDGDGIVDAEKEKIFERGFGKNTGLGLFLSKEILGITGITLRETGKPGTGARFEVTVPRENWRESGPEL